MKKIYTTINKKGNLNNISKEELLKIEDITGSGSSNSYSTTETLTGGTWIDGKPIYTITQLTVDPVPADIETQFPNIIVGDYTIYKYTKTTD